MKQPVISPEAMLAPDAVVCGDVTIAPGCSLWFHAVLRAESAAIRMGEGSNVQDNCVVHVDAGYDVDIGPHVTIGHGAILHGCTVGGDADRYGLHRAQRGQDRKALPHRRRQSGDPECGDP